MVGKPEEQVTLGESWIWAQVQGNLLEVDPQDRIDVARSSLVLQATLVGSSWAEMRKEAAAIQELLSEYCSVAADCTRVEIGLT